LPHWPNDIAIRFFVRDLVEGSSDVKKILEVWQTSANRSADLSSSLLAGALGGLVATVPMTATLELLHRRLPWWERYQLPPSQIVARLSRRLGLRRHMDQPEHLTVTLLAHFGYGSAAGAVYAPIAERVPLPGMLKGVIFGLLVWSTSYLGLLPALGILRPATRHPPRRTALMIIAHVVWGATLGLATGLIRSRQ
jgi:uncharacterized membrane protein YagU involved in acid resistance